MKKLIFSTLVVLLTLSCNSNDGKKMYGEKFEVASPITPDELIQAIDKDSTAKDIQVSGTIDESCAHTGCWITLKNDKDKTIFVSYKDDGFTTAKEIDGRQVTLIGSGSYNWEKEQYEFIATGVILN